MSENKLDTGVLFGSHHTMRDYGLYLTTRPDTGSPKPKTYSQDIPGADGTLDLTEATTGEVKYSNRTVTIKAKRIIPYEEQEALKSQIMGDLHGKKMKVILDEDPERYFLGRVTVTVPSRTKDQMYVTFTVDAQPYKLAVQETDLQLPIVPDPYITFDVLLATDNSQSSMNANFDIAANDPRGDWSRYNSVYVQFPSAVQYITRKSLQVVSGSSAEGTIAVYNRDVTSNEFNHRQVVIDKAALTDAGLDITDIRRVLVSGMGSTDHSSIKLYGTLVAASFTLVNAQMSVVPEFYVPASTIVKVYFGGAKYDLEEGWNKIDDILLPAGSSHLLFEANQNTEVRVRYRMGWL